VKTRFPLLSRARQGLRLAQQAPKLAHQPEAMVYSSTPIVAPALVQPAGLDHNATNQCARQIVLVQAMVYAKVVLPTLHHPRVSAIV
jgi:hypothetical protein